MPEHCLGVLLLWERETDARWRRHPSGGETMDNKLGIAALALLIAVPTSSALAKKTKRSDRNTTIEISYGLVESVEVVKLKSNAAKGAAIGGFAGLAVGGSSTKNNLENGRRRRRGRSPDRAPGVQAQGAAIHNKATRRIRDQGDHRSRRCHRGRLRRRRRRAGHEPPPRRRYDVHGRRAPRRRVGCRTGAGAMRPFATRPRISC